MKKVKIYTDGACSGNPGEGGWAAVLMYGEHTKEISGYENETTNNRMELKAVIEALKILKEPCEVDLHSDSSYVVNAFDKGWVYGWSKNGWITSGKEEVKNKELWMQLLELNKTHKINWIKVKGHDEDELNNRCDAMARKQIKDNKKGDGDELRV